MSDRFLASVMIGTIFAATGGGLIWYWYQNLIWALLGTIGGGCVGLVSYILLSHYRPTD